MIQVLALTQFAFLVLGVVFLKILANATSVDVPVYLEALNRGAIWLLAIPPAWVFFASLCLRDGRRFAVTLARASGVGVAVLCFLFLASVAYLFPG